eukprot:gene5741-5981_t
MGVSSEALALLPKSDLDAEDSRRPNNPQDLLLQKWKVPLIVLYYGLCSSTLIVINKVAVHTVEAPVFILLLQLLFSAFTVKGFTISGVLDAEGLQWSLMKPFALIIVAFLGTLFANIKVLMYSNVETFITARSSTPLVLSVCDFLFLGRELPGRRSVCSLLLLVASCAGYTMFDQGFKIEAYTWLLVWYIFFTFEATYVKHVCDTVQMSNWGRVYYTNILAGMALLAAFPFCTTEHDVLRVTDFSWNKIIVLGLSCAVGVGMSHAGYLLRSNVSATSSVVVGVVCKIGSVLLNLMIWDQHASGVQLVFLSLGLLGGSLFQQAPLRQQPAAVVQFAGTAKSHQKVSFSSAIVVEVAAGPCSRGSSADGHSNECLNVTRKAATAQC